MRVRSFVCVLALGVFLNSAFGADDDRTVWKYAEGSFESLGEGKWVERVGTEKFEWAEKRRNATVVELYDATRKQTITIFPTNARLRKDGAKVSDVTTIKGAWEKTEVKPKPSTITQSSTKYTEISKLAPEPVRSDDIAISPDGKLIARTIGKVGSEQFAIVDAVTGKTVKTWNDRTGAHRLEWSRDGRSLAAIHIGKRGKTADNKQPAEVVVWDTTKWEAKAIFELRVLESKSSLTISGDGSYVGAIGDHENLLSSAYVWDVAKKKRIFFANPAGAPPTLALSADGQTVVVSQHILRSEAIPYKLPSGKSEPALRALSPFVLSADGKTVVSFAKLTGLSVWTSQDPLKAVKTLKLDDFAADAGVLLDDDKHVALAGREGDTDQVRIYDVKTLTLQDVILVSKTIPANKFIYLKATPDSSALATYGSDGVVRVWKTPFAKK
jgi:WD40 repeat protein